MGEAPTTLNDLAVKVTELSETLTKFFRDNDVPAPTLAADSPTKYEKLTPEVFMTRQKLADALMDMWYLCQGPSESISNYVHNCMPDAAALNILNYFDFWSAVPLDGSASYEAIAKHTNLPEDVVRRIIEHATTVRIFAETSPGSPSTEIQHTSRSAALAKSSGLRALVSTVLDDAGPPMTIMTEALRRYSVGKPSITEDMSKTSFALFHSGGVFGTNATPWDFIENDGEGDRKGWRQRIFTDFMSYIKEIFRLEAVVADSLDWKAAGKAQVVDLGGSGGHDAFVLAEKFPDLTITVQDLPEAESTFKKTLPAELEGRVKYLAHDFFKPQPVEADIYMIKLILHDWPDEESVKILRAQTLAMKPGSRIMFIDYLGKQAETQKEPLPRSIQQMGTATDLRMMALFNAKERTIEDWTNIFRKVDEKLKIIRVNANPLTFIILIEAVWKG